MKKQILATIALVVTIAAQMPVIGQNSAVKSSAKNGINSTVVMTEAGTITMYLPSSLEGGATISGTVQTQAKGKNERQIEGNKQYLSGIVVGLEGAQAKPAPGGTLVFALPAATTRLWASVKDSRGNTLSRFPVEVVPRRTDKSASHNPEAFNVPELAQTGEIITLEGPADGDLTNTILQVGGRLHRPLAESPDGIFFIPDPDYSGVVPVTVNENGVESSANVRLVNIRMSAEQASLNPGVQSALNLSVSGLENITEPVFVEVNNENPNAVNLLAGNQQIIEIRPDQVSTAGTFLYNTNFIGLAPGAFEITAAVLPAQSQHPNEKENYAIFTPASNNQQAPLPVQAQQKTPACNCDKITATITLENSSRKRELESNLERINKEIASLVAQLQDTKLSANARTNAEDRLKLLIAQQVELEKKIKNKVFEETRIVEHDISSDIAKNGDRITIKVRVSNVDAQVCDCLVAKDCVFNLTEIPGFRRVENPVDTHDVYYEYSQFIAQNSPTLDFTVGGECSKEGCNTSKYSEKVFRISFKLK